MAGLFRSRLPSPSNALNSYLHHLTRLASPINHTRFSQLHPTSNCLTTLASPVRYSTVLVYLLQQRCHLSVHSEIVSVDRSFPQSTMAPSLRGAGTRTRKAQPTVLGYAKVTKASTVTTGRKGVKLTIENVDTLLNPAGETSEPTTTPPIGDKKRKRGIYASEAEESETEEIPVGKKVVAFLSCADSLLTRCSSRSSSHHHHLQNAQVAALQEKWTTNVSVPAATIARPAHLPCRKVSKISSRCTST